ETTVRTPAASGVALLDEKQASGRRFRRAYLLRALEGAYGGTEVEDYFVPEEGRGSSGTFHGSTDGPGGSAELFLVAVAPVPGAALANPAEPGVLPRRFRG